MYRLLLAAALVAAGPARAAPLDVVTDIAPLAALVADVQQGRGSVAAVVEPGMDAHHVSLRPSQARAIAEADLAVWIGPALSPWFGTALDRLAPDSKRLPVLDLAPVRLERRGAVDDDHGDGAHDIDPHAWLEPRNAAAWLGDIAEALAAADPGHADAYRANAAAAAAALEAEVADLATAFAAAPVGPYVAGHDSFQYAEALSGANFAGAVSDSHATAPGPAHLAEIEARLEKGGVSCLLTGAETAPRVLDQLAERFGLPVVAFDSLGAEIRPGGYTAWLSALGSALGDCKRGVHGRVVP